MSSASENSFAEISPSKDARWHDLAYKVLSGDEIKEGIDLEQDGYDSVKIQEGVNRCVLGNAPLILNKDNIDDYDF